MVYTINDVAREAGVSVSTVSKVLNGTGSITEATAARVKEVVARLNFTPNSRAQAFAQQSSGVIGILSDFGRGTAFNYPHLFELIGGLEEGMRERNYLTCLIGTGKMEATLERIDHYHKTRKVDGFVLHASDLHRSIIHYLVASSVPHVVIGQMPEEEGVCWVDLDNELGGSLALSHLINGGRKRILCVLGPEKERISEQRLSGIRSAAHSVELIVRHCDGSPAGAEAVALGALSEGKGSSGACDGVITVSNPVAHGVLEALRKTRLRVPEDVSLITFDNDPYSPFMGPYGGLTVVDMDVYELGKRAGFILVERIKRKTDLAAGHRIVPNIIVRASAP